MPARSRDHLQHSGGTITAARFWLPTIPLICPAACDLGWMLPAPLHNTLVEAGEVPLRKLSDRNWTDNKIEAFLPSVGTCRSPDSLSLPCMRQAATSFLCHGTALNPTPWLARQSCDHAQNQNAMVPAPAVAWLANDAIPWLMQGIDDEQGNFCEETLTGCPVWLLPTQSLFMN